MNFTVLISYEFLLFCRGFRLYFLQYFHVIFIRIFFSFAEVFRRILHCIFIWISLCFIWTFTLYFVGVFYIAYFIWISSLFLQQIDYHTFYIALHLYTNFSMNFECCTLETMNLIVLLVLFEFLMQNPSYNVSDCPLLANLYFHCLWDSLQSNFSHIATNYCPMCFL